MKTQPQEKNLTDSQIKDIREVASRALNTYYQAMLDEVEGGYPYTAGYSMSALKRIISIIDDREGIYYD